MLAILIRRALKGTAMTAPALHDMLDREFTLHDIQAAANSLISTGRLHWRRNHNGRPEYYRPDAPPRPAGHNPGGETIEPNIPSPPKRHPSKSPPKLKVLRHIADNPGSTNRQVTAAFGCNPTAASSALSGLTQTMRIVARPGTKPRQYDITERGLRALNGYQRNPIKWTDNIITPTRRQAPSAQQATTA
ncbi:hypothetical protein JN531_012095 [Flagellatimonas centrodinii]|uniref:hypothetical protein n=1 Tax=Flagellatimonas centrodinii TaxID=2806210 RepID=UPI001FF96323|nr:hypothetical protein [Flagellatimonas centrodinii]ULQ45841.1 hypothetical protein JN531_012095 [Flagellatimonas centrodinii]